MGTAIEEYRAAKAALVQRVSAAVVAADQSCTRARDAASATATVRRGKRGGLGVKPRRVLGALPPDEAPMAWYCAPRVDAWPVPVLYRCAARTLVRAGVAKTSGAVLKLAPGMEALVDGAANADDGTPRLRLASPVRGWASAKCLETVCVAAVAQSSHVARPARSRQAWRSAAPRFPDAPAPPYIRPPALTVEMSTMGGARVPVFVAAAAVRLGAAPKPPAAPEPVPGVAGCFFVAGVLGDAQCAALAALGDALGDVAAASTDEAFFRSGTHSRIFLDVDGAVRAALAPVLDACPRAGEPDWPADGAAPPGGLLGLNAKCRFLRYADGASFQPHTDPAWPASDPARGAPPGASVLCRRPGADSPLLSGVDAVVAGAASWCSVITYLNDDFGGGETTFYVDAGGATDLVAVAPRRGACLVFFHGRHRLSPTHEGSPVRGGTKSVLRTDVLYAGGA